MTFLSDSFTASNGTLLSDHTPGVGGAWSKHSSSGSPTASIDGGRLRTDSATSSISAYQNAATPPSADYVVAVDVVRTGSPGSGTQAAGVMGRTVNGASTFYEAMHDNNAGAPRWRLRRLSGGSSTTLGTASATLTQDQAYRLELVMIGNQISLVVDGVTVIGPITNGDITAAGLAAVRFFGTDIYRLDNFAARPTTATGSGSASLTALTAAGSGTHAPPVYAGSGAATLPALAGAGGGTHAPPVYAGAGSAALPALSASGAGAHTAPVYAGSGTLGLPALTVAGTGAHAAPAYTGAGAATLPGLSAAGSGAHTPPAYTGAGAPALPLLTGSGAGAYGATIYTGSGAATLPALAGAGSGAHAPPIYAGGGSTTLSALSATGAGAHTPPVYAGAGAAVLPALVGAGAGIYTAGGAPAIAGDGRLIALPARVRSITLPARPRAIALPARVRSITLPERS